MCVQAKLCECARQRRFLTAEAVAWWASVETRADDTSTREATPLDGSTPTLLYGYGGFEISLTPGYAATVGAAWLEKGQPEG